MMRRVLVSVLAMTALLALGACGGDDDDETTSPTTAAGPGSTTAFKGDANSPFCQLGRANNARLQAIGAAAANPDELDRVLRDAAPAVRQAADIAPDEIKKDVDLLADAFEDLLKSLDEGQPDLGAIVSPEFTTAAQNLTNYGRDVCGITG